MKFKKSYKNKQQSKRIKKLAHYQKKQHKMNEKKLKTEKLKKIYKQSPLVLENLVFKLQLAHGKERRGSPIPTMEIKAIAM